MRIIGAFALFLGAAGLTACSTAGSPFTRYEAPPSEGVDTTTLQDQEYPEYVIGPYDSLTVFVWRAPELSAQVQVRPDGRISTPLVEDIIAAGKSPTQLSAELEDRLGQYVRSPEVTVIVSGFSSTFDQQVRVLGEAQQPSAIPYQAGMTVLDVMISVGGLTDFAAGNRAKLIRGRGEDKQTYRLRLGDLLRNGDVSADVALQPGDVILIPEAIF
ncbi:XrtA/PEP-CTERM system exopolysaccharide export protein [Parvularcula lutaonensis]|uniref:XrtA/PEP-CTERM system exopolysaccharide export protein n=1 Tax=Parvularcula lutaonensis TaxID=491923 RepID=A0ABV7MCE5_9PROT|nr:XrtA/PEP-CTERM system exopolysaccharide export protein [Parvularcula lutaonensis]GGY38960.1 sugar ABC transporter substrate-binding protein [Parvularcula lutaonensis]